MSKFTERHLYLKEIYFREILEENGVIPSTGEGGKRASRVVCKYQETADRAAYDLRHDYMWLIMNGYA